jgi:hypothetical protein
MAARATFVVVLTVSQMCDRVRPRRRLDGRRLSCRSSYAPSVTGTTRNTKQIPKRSEPELNSADVLDRLRSTSPAGTALGEEIRHWIVGLIALGLLIFGPIDHDSPYGIAVRLGYLVLVPLAVWIGLAGFWRIWRPDRSAEVRLGRALAGTLAGMLLIGSLLASQDEYHLVCTEEVSTGDETECVGDYVPVPGPDAFEVVLLAGLAIAAFRVASAPWTRYERETLEASEPVEDDVILLPSPSCARCGHAKAEHWYGGKTTWPCRYCANCPDFGAA